MTTYYVDGAVGNDSNAGTAEGAGNAWATLTKAYATLVGLDICYVKNSVTYNETAVMTNVGTINNGIRIEGYETTPGDDGIVTHTAGTGGCVTNNRSYWTIKNFKFSSTNTSQTVDVGSNCALYNCHFYNCSGYGAKLGLASGTNQCTFINCWGGVSANAVEVKLINTAIKGCTTQVGAFLDARCYVHKCIFADNAALDIYCPNANDYQVFSNNLFDANGTAYCIDSRTSVVYGSHDNIVLNTANPGYLHRVATTEPNWAGWWGNNVFDSNVVEGDYLSADSITYFGDSPFSGILEESSESNVYNATITFVDSANGDYTPASDSDAIGAGSSPPVAVTP